MSCNRSRKSKLPENFEYNSFKDSIQGLGEDTALEATNILDTTLFIPAEDSVETLLTSLDSLWHKDLQVAGSVDTLFKMWKKEDEYTPEELAIILDNVAMLDSFFADRKLADSGTCEGMDCLVYAEVVKSTQTMYLYLDGVITDSFKVSTGIARYATPNMSRRPSGPIFRKYTSKKYPGGNHRGLGNMPYAVFLRGGYAIHGTTKGNFPKLGIPASHGCVRLHPTNAKIFNELVRRMGLDNTWVVIKDSL